MKYWIIPSNDNIFNIDHAISANGGLVDWRISNIFSVGDIAFIYKTSPYRCIRYKTEVIKIGFYDKDTLVQEAFWTDKKIYYSGLGSSKYVRLKLIETINDEVLSLYNLRKFGLKGNIQSVQGINNEKLLSFILNPNEILD